MEKHNIIVMKVVHTNNILYIKSSDLYNSVIIFLYNTKLNFWFTFNVTEANE